MTGQDTLTLTVLQDLADLLRAVQAKAAVTWYPNIASPEVKATRVLRAFTRPDGNFIAPGSDVRDACVWSSGITEWFTPVSEMLAAMLNARDGHDDTGPALTLHS